MARLFKYIVGVAVRMHSSNPLLRYSFVLCVFHFSPARPSPRPHVAPSTDTERLYMRAGGGFCAFSSIVQATLAITIYRFHKDKVESQVIALPREVY